ncbi:MAG: hypothetical protein HUJ51_00045 [Eggerthellaceae bacterium]|nr:hypothetical protein [Eggerthellaceae bacterium]
MSISQGFFPKHNIIVVCGHYGVGKTNLCLNLALKFCQKTTLVDLDLVNPFFRSSEYKTFCEKHGIKLISPTLANTTVDIPSISGQIQALVKEHIENAEDGLLIIDLGGDDQGSKVAGRFANLLNPENSQLCYVLNFKRNLTLKIGQAYELMQEIQAASSLKIDSVINNTHLGEETDLGTIEAGLGKAKDFSHKYFLNLAFSTAPNILLSTLCKQHEDDTFFAIERIVRTI